MDYPRYRQQGLPIMSGLVESLIKQFNRRVKGTEKFWNEAQAETFLQLRASQLSEDGRLAEQVKKRPISAFRSYKTTKRNSTVSRPCVWYNVFCTNCFGCNYCLPPPP